MLKVSSWRSCEYTYKELQQFRNFAQRAKLKKGFEEQLHDFARSYEFNKMIY